VVFEEHHELVDMGTFMDRDDAVMNVGLGL
jgi:hypothetical protein